MEQKQCKGPCGLAKPLEEFVRDSSRSDGYKNICKIDHAAERRRRRSDDPELAERDRAACRRSRERGGEVARAVAVERSRQWYADNREYELEWHREYDAEHRDEKIERHPAVVRGAPRGVN